MSEKDTIGILDSHFARHLGCSPGDLNTAGLTCVEFSPETSDKDRTPPKPIWILHRNSSRILSAQPWALALVEPLLRISMVSPTLAEAPLERIRTMIEERTSVWLWFLGYQFYCDTASFTPRFDGRCRPVTRDDAAAGDLESKHYYGFSGVSIENGDVFGLFLGDELASYAWIKPRGDLAAPIGVVTVEKHRRRGFGAAAVSAATAEILKRGKIPIYDCDQDNVASSSLARSLGYSLYAEDFGCIQR